MPESATNRKHQRHGKHGRHDDDCELVHHVFDIALFVTAMLGVHHNASLRTRVDDKAHNPVGVAQKRALQQHLLVFESIILAADLEPSLEGVQITVRGLDLAETSSNEFVRLESFASRRHDSVEILGNFPCLEGLFTVQRARLNIARSGLVARRHQHQVSWEHLITFANDEVSDLQVLRLRGDYLTTLEDPDRLPIGDFVGFVSGVVFDSFSNHGYDQHERERQVSRDGRHGADQRDRVEDSLDQEVEVWQSFELKEERERQKVQQGILGRPYVVRRHLW